MARREGQIRVEYEGRIPEALREHLQEAGVCVTETKPLTMLAGRPEIVLNQIMRYLNDNEMQVRRVVLRSARAA